MVMNEFIGRAVTLKKFHFPFVRYRCISKEFGSGF